MDGVDLACCDLAWDGHNWDYKILAAETFPYDDELLLKLEHACKWSREEIDELDLELGNYYAGLLNDFHQKKKLQPDFIASHGHTILHDPGRGITLQAPKQKAYKLLYRDPDGKTHALGEIQVPEK